MTRQTYLLRKTGRYHFRRRFAFLGASGRPIMVALRTADPVDARNWARRLAARWDKVTLAMEEAFDRGTLTLSEQQTDDPTELSAWHVVMDLPTKLPPARWQDFVTGFVERELTAKGAVVAWAIHAVEAADGSWLVRPHLHLCVTAKMWRHNSRHGRRHIAWLGNWARQRSFELAWRRACRLSEAMRAWRSAPRHKRESNPRNERSFQAT